MVVIVALVGGRISVVNFTKLNQANDWNVHSYKVLRHSDDMLTQMVNMETGIRGYVASGEERFLEPYNAGKRQFDISFDDVKALTADNVAQQQRLAKLREFHTAIEQVDQKLIDMRKGVSTGSTTTQSLIDYFKEGHDKQAMDAYRALATEFNNAEETLLASRSDLVVELSTSTKWCLSLAALTTVLLSAGLGTWITRSIVRALGGEPDVAAAAASEIASGNLVAAIPLTRGNATSLMASLEAMRIQLNTIVREIQFSSEAITVTAGQIAQGNTDLSQRTEEQAASLEETAASMEELSANVRQNTGNASQANSLAVSACDVAARGGQVMGQVTATMQEISQSSDKVAEIIGEIEGISFQTNILALNAAVEVARAGEQGRGFAFVATEVRSLAQRSATAAREIKELVSQSVERVAHGSEQVSLAGATMDEIVGVVKHLTSLIGEVAAASREQDAGIEQVNVAVSQMDAVTQRNAALVEESAAAAQSMAGQAKSLRDAIGIFQVEVGQVEGTRVRENIATGRSSISPVALPA
jgi:methyl-accepting chemotaxis protein